MATKKGSGTKKSSGKADAKTSRCWPGFEPVPGKSEHEEGSCRKKPASRNGGSEPDRERSRKKQIALGGKRAEQAKSKSPKKSERASAGKPAAKKKTVRKTAEKKTPRKSAAKSATRKPAATSAK